MMLRYFSFAATPASVYLRISATRTTLLPIRVIMPPCRIARERRVRCRGAFYDGNIYEAAKYYFSRPPLFDRFTAPARSSPASFYALLRLIPLLIASRRYRSIRCHAAIRLLRHVYFVRF